MVFNSYPLPYKEVEVSWLTPEPYEWLYGRKVGTVPPNDFKSAVGWGNNSRFSKKKSNSWNLKFKWQTSNTHLHANDGIDEEEHGDEQAHIRQSLPEKMKREGRLAGVCDRACTSTTSRSINGTIPWRTGQRSTTGCGWSLLVSAAW